MNQYIKSRSFLPIREGRDLTLPWQDYTWISGFPILLYFSVNNHFPVVERISRLSDLSTHWHY